MLTIVVVCTPLAAQGEAAAGRILINNVNIFDGRNEKLIPDRSMPVEGDRIARLAGSVAAPDAATVIDCGGRTLTPGCIDAPVHLQWNMGAYEFVDSPPDYHAALALVEVRNMLMRGFTSVRDTGGALSGIKKPSVSADGVP